MAAHIARLRHPAPADLSSLAPYYATKSYSASLAEGRAAVVNAVAYRSPRLGVERDNRTIIPKLPSCQLHLRWVAEHLLRQAAEGKRLVVVHRNGLWKLDRKARRRGVVFSAAPASPSLSRTTLGEIETFLDGPRPR